MKFTVKNRNIVKKNIKKLIKLKSNFQKKLLIEKWKFKMMKLIMISILKGYEKPQKK
jgi:hypothetical protein